MGLPGEHPAGPVRQPLKRAPALLAVRVLLLLGASGATLAAFAIARRLDGGAGGAASTSTSTSTGAAATAAPPAAVYTCPMHSEVRAPGPGDCPICRMALQPAQARTGEEVRVPAGAASPVAAADVRRPAPLSPRRELILPAWLEAGGEVVALLHQDDLAQLEPGEDATFRPDARGGGALALRLLSASTLSARFRVASTPSTPPSDARPGTSGTLRLAARATEALVIPAAAVLESPDGPFVMLASADRRTFVKRAVTLGRVADGQAVVRGGLAAADDVVIARAFFLDAERRAAP